MVGDLRYADAGVDIDEGNRAVSLIRRTIASTHTAQVLGGIGAFSGLFALDPGSPTGTVLASSTDSVGTKVKVAIAAGRHRGIGIDLVNHCINDILCCGADPLFFLDYYATGQTRPGAPRRAHRGDRGGRGERISERWLASGSGHAARSQHQVEIAEPGHRQQWLQPAGQRKLAGLDRHDPDPPAGSGKLNDHSRARVGLAGPGRSLDR